jgi:hypothetical protein
VHTDMLERKALALKAWDDRLRGIVMGEEAAKVVPLTRARNQSRLVTHSCSSLALVGEAVIAGGEGRSDPRRTSHSNPDVWASR